MSIYPILHQLPLINGSDSSSKIKKTFPNPTIPKSLKSIISFMITSKILKNTVSGNKIKKKDQINNLPRHQQPQQPFASSSPINDLKIEKIDER